METNDERIKRIEDRIELIEFRIQQIAASPSSASLSNAAHTPKPLMSHSASGSMSGSASTVPSRTVPYKPKNVDVDAPSYSTSKILGVVGIVCFVLASVLLVKMSIDSGWLTPSRQVAISAFFGFLLISAGLIPSLEEKRYISLLPGAGIVILNLAVYGGFFVHSLYAAEVAIAMSLGIAGLALYLFSIWRFDFYVVTATIGTYFSAWLLSSDLGKLSTICFLLVIWDITYSILSVWLKSRLMVLISSYLGLGTIGLLGLGVTDVSNLQIMIGVQAIQFLIFVSGVVYYSVLHNEPLKDEETWLFFPLLLFFYGSEYWLIAKVSPTLAPWLGLAFGAFVLVLYKLASSKISKSLNSGQMVYIFCSIVFFHAFYINILPDDWKSLFGIGAIIALAFSSTKLDLNGKHLGIGIAGLGFILIGYGMSLLGTYSNSEAESFLTNFGYAFAILFVSSSLLSRKATETNASLKKDNSQLGYVILGAAHIQVLTSLYRLASLWVWPIPASLVISLFWILYAITVLVYGMKIKNGIWARSSLFVLLFCTLKVFLWDLTSAPAIARVISFLALGAVLYGFGFLYKKIATL